MTEPRAVVVAVAGLCQQAVVAVDGLEQTIINTFNKHEAVEDFTVVVSYEQIAEKNYSFSAGQYFEVKIEYTDIIYLI